ncbi:cyclin, N-terminal domain protein [Pelomyxa schiedti]|nr:cyclin, N-terminal domain protein [Pelomyxa schiedti]
MESPIYVQISRLLTRLIEAQRPFVQSSPPQNTAFEAARVPGITLESYIKRLEQYSGCNRTTMVAALVFIDRILEKNPLFFLTEKNAHRLLLSCLVTALKFYEDSFYSNKFYAKVGGVSMLEMNALELTQLKMVQFDLYITPESFAQYDDAVTAITGLPAQEPNQGLECTTPPGSPSPSSTPAPPPSPQLQVTTVEVVTATVKPSPTSSGPLYTGTSVSPVSQEMTYADKDCSQYQVHPVVTPSFTCPPRFSTPPPQVDQQQGNPQRIKRSHPAVTHTTVNSYKAPRTSAANQYPPQQQLSQTELASHWVSEHQEQVMQEAAALHLQMMRNQRTTTGLPDTCAATPSHPQQHNQGLMLCF